MTMHRGRCSRRYSKSSADAPGQFVSSNSCKCLSCIRLDNPLDVSNGHPGIKLHILMIHKLKKCYHCLK